MLIHDILKIRYTNAGYLINYPYHMVSDAEMFKAFMDNNGAGFLADNYPCLSTNPDVIKAYNQLVLSILYHIDLFMVLDVNVIPDWIYSFMLGSVISVNSDKLDIHDLSVQLGTSNLADEFTAACSDACYAESQNWLGGATYDLTIPIISGYESIINAMLNAIPVTNNPEGLYTHEINTFYDLAHLENNDKIFLRPATMFGEPHVLKSLRLKQNAL